MLASRLHRGNYKTSDDCVKMAFNNRAMQATPGKQGMTHTGWSRHFKPSDDVLARGKRGVGKRPLSRASTDDFEKDDEEDKEGDGDDDATGVEVTRSRSAELCSTQPAYIATRRRSLSMNDRPSPLEDPHQSSGSELTDEGPMLPPPRDKTTSLDEFDEFNAPSNGLLAFALNGNRQGKRSPKPITPGDPSLPAKPPPPPPVWVSSDPPAKQVKKKGKKMEFKATEVVPAPEHEKMARRVQELEERLVHNEAAMSTLRETITSLQVKLQTTENQLKEEKERNHRGCCSVM